jgi:hypothetical protein
MAIDPRVKIMPRGLRCHKLTIVGHAGSIRGKDNSTACWEVACDCGRRLVVQGWALRSGHTKSCGSCARADANRRRHR